MGKENLYLSLSVDCESNQQSINDKELGENAVNGLMNVCRKERLKLTLFVIPKDIEASPALYEKARKEGHELGLHLHPAEQGYDEFLGTYSPDIQKKIISEAKEIFFKVMGFNPEAFCAGYGSANDYTYSVLEDLGFTHGLVSIPTRVLPECASVWAGAPLDIHYANRWNRLLYGDLNFVEMPATLDPDSRMWGGKHPQDLRVELVDAKNHWYTIQKSIFRQMNDNTLKIKRIHATTHNIFRYDKKDNFRRITLEKIIKSVKNICQEQELELVAATSIEIAAEYRKQFPLKNNPLLQLDKRARI